MGGKRGSKQKVTEHYMSMHVGICAAGDGLELIALKVGEKEAWRGRLINNGVAFIDKTALFGGNKKEGGLRGLAWWLNGNESQSMPAELARRFKRTVATCPGFRGLASVFFTGLLHDDPPETPANPDIWHLVPGYNDCKGFYWTANNPYLRAISARVRRAPRGLNPAISLIRIQNDSRGNTQYAANPAHIIFEAMTNRDWGLGESFGAFDIASYEDAAQTLYEEEFGMNVLWSRQSKIEDFIQDVLDHIQGAQYVDPATGKHTLKLLRAVPLDASIPVVNPDNARMMNFKMKVWGEITNEVVVTWTNPETGKEETVTSQDLAAIAAQGAQPSSSSRNYHGIASRKLAIKVADRDLAAVAHPIATCEVEVSNELWRTVTYDVVNLSWPDRQIDRAFFRVSNVSNGTNSNTVKLSLYEDIFSLNAANYLDPEIDTGWEDESNTPLPLTIYQLGTAPAFMASAALGLNDPSELVYPQVVSAISIAPNTADDVGYELLTYEADVTGTMVQVSLGDRILRGRFTLPVNLASEASTNIDGRLSIVGARPAPGSFALIGSADDRVCEIAMFRQVTPKRVVLDRGMLDTVPRTWSAGTTVYIIPSDGDLPDVTPRAAFETVSYHFRTQSSIGALPIEDTPQVDFQLSERPHLPNRPANVRVGGQGFGTYEFYSGSSVLVTWSRRNRLHEVTQAMRWTAGDMLPETGQTTTIRIMREDRTTISVVSGLTGTSYSLDRSTLDGEASVILRVTSSREGFESLQGHEIFVRTQPPIVYDFQTLSGDANETGDDLLALSGDEDPGNLII